MALIRKMIALFTSFILTVLRAKSKAAARFGC